MRPLLLLALLLITPLAGLAQSPVNLVIDVQVDSQSDLARGGYATRSRSTQSGQRLLVMDGGQASIHVGATQPLRLRQIQRGPWGEIIAEQIVYRALGSGFRVRPRLAGERVIVDITAISQEASPGSASVSAVELATTISGRLGEWIPLGDSSASSQGEEGTLQGQRILLRVDLAQ